MEFRKMITITLCTRQQKRHWCIEIIYFISMFYVLWSTIMMLMTPSWRTHTYGMNGQRDRSWYFISKSLVKRMLFNKDQTRLVSVTRALYICLCVCVCVLYIYVCVYVCVCVCVCVYGGRRSYIVVIYSGRRSASKWGKDFWRNWCQN